MHLTPLTVTDFIRWVIEDIREHMRCFKVTTFEIPRVTLDGPLDMAIVNVNVLMQLECVTYILPD